MVVQPGVAVIPGTDTVFFQKGTGQVLHAENAAHVDEAARDETERAEEHGQGPDEGSHAVDGKHPRAGLAHEF